MALVRLMHLEVVVRVFIQVTSNRRPAEVTSQDHYTTLLAIDDQVFPYLFDSPTLPKPSNVFDIGK